jgi:hypothetical protein
MLATNRGALMKMVLAAITLAGFLVAFGAVEWAPSASAHPGNTDSRGCHTCRANCAKWGLSNGQYHCHGGAPAPARPAATATPTPIPLATANSSAVTRAAATIANTGGDGVARRWDCKVTSKYGGAGLAERSQVTITRVGTGACKGWSVVVAGTAQSWVQDIYLKR